MTPHHPIKTAEIDWKKAKLCKVSITLDGHATSLSLETSFLEALKNIAKAKGVPFARLVGKIDTNRPPEINLSSALRLAVLAELQHKS